MRVFHVVHLVPGHACPVKLIRSAFCPFHRLRWCAFACLILVSGCTADFEQELAAALQRVEIEVAGEAVEQSLPDSEESTQEKSGGETEVDQVSLHMGMTDEGWPYLGSPEAPIVITEYSDFHCPYCGRHATETLPDIREELINPGLVQYVVKDLPLESIHPHARLAHRSAWCMGLQSVQAFWWMHEALYLSQSQHARSADAVHFYQALAADFNELPDSDAKVDLGAFSSCLLDTGNEVDQRIDDSIASALDMGIQGTPTFTVHKRENPDRYLVLRGAQPFPRFEAAVHDFEQHLAAAESDAEAESANGEELPYWLSAQGLTPLLLWTRQDANGEHPPVWHGLTQAGDFFKGSPLAEVVVYEFSDFQCPYCQQHTATVQESLDASWVDSGKVMWIYKHFLLNSSSWSGDGAVATMCAGLQGRFWDLHRLLFEDPNAWTHREVQKSLDNFGSVLFEAAPDGWQMASLPEAVERGEAVLDDLSDLEFFPRLEFDEQSYQACRKATNTDLITLSMAQVQGVVRGTPTFIIWHRDYGLLAQPVVGSLPSEQFQSVFEQIFAQLSSLDSSG